MNKYFSRLWKRAIFALLIVSLANILITCRTPEPVIYPIDTDNMVVARLDNGNYEVKPGFIHNYFKLIAENVVLRLKVEKFERKELEE